MTTTVVFLRRRNVMALPSALMLRTKTNAVRISYHKPIVQRMYENEGIYKIDFK